MLVLGRKKEQTILIGHDHEITIKVVDYHGRIVKLGIDAPADMPILRGELEREARDNGGRAEGQAEDT